MGCICSKDSNIHDYAAENYTENYTEARKSSVRVLHAKGAIEITKSGQLFQPSYENGKTRIIERPKNGHQRSASGVNGAQHEKVYRVVGVAKAEKVAAGWPSWLASVAGEAIHGWTPRSPESYQKLNKIGQGTYSSVYRARDLATDKIVAMKKVRFVNMDPESVRFMAREICILRRLDHPNVMKLEGLVTSRISGSLYLVFEYMEHDLAGLVASPKVKFTQPQIKCYARQMFLGLEHCHSRGVLHRDIKGSNLLVDNNGILKIADFGLATFFSRDQKQPLTSHVVTLWYRAPELLLGATQYGVEIDMWSAGCIIAELFAGKPIMPGRTEVEQMHKIFKLCGSPTEDYWTKTKFPHASSFKSQRPYKRRVADVFNYFPASALAIVQGLLSIDPDLRGTASSALTSKFFTSNPLPCDPSSLPKYPPSKEFDAKLREDEARRRKVDNAKGHEVEYGQSTKDKVGERSFHVVNNGHPRTSNAVIHPKGVLSYENVNEQTTLGSSRRSVQLSRQASELPSFKLNSSNGTSNNGARKNRMFCSGPIVGPGGNMDDMLKEHERQIQDALRKSRVGKGKAKAKSKA